MPAEIAIVWFRNDLRLSDNPALHTAISAGYKILPVFIRDDAAAGDWALGGASLWWLNASLKALSDKLQQHGAGLVLRNGPAQDALNTLIGETGAKAVFWNRRYEPWAVKRDKAVKAALQEAGIKAVSTNGRLLYEPWTIETKSGTPYAVFTPFYKSCLAKGAPHAPLGPCPDFNAANTPAGPDADKLIPPPKPDWAGGLRKTWQPGETGAQERLADFLDDTITHYKSGRDIPAEEDENISRMSPHLAFGEISPRQIWHAVSARMHSHDLPENAAQPYLRQLIWREFYAHVLFHNPDLPDTPYQKKFTAFAWRDDDTALRAWQKGQTGVPIIDAAMRQLWQTGWMHNRPRMIAGSYLVKHLLLHWRHGENWFWDTLVDADLAQNAGNWQWVAGCGTDAAPYFRIFNPVTQGKKFDPGGKYVRRYVPELAGLPDEHIHAPWDAPADVLKTAGIALGRDYPHPLVDLRAGRQRALSALEELKRTTDKYDFFPVSLNFSPINPS